MLLIRKATKADMPRVCALNDVVQRLHADHRPNLYRWSVDPDGRLAILDKARTDQAWRLWVADQEGDLLGYVATELMEKSETALRKPHTEGHIHHISVDPAAHRKGVGGALVRQAIAALREQCADRITVGYWAFNKPSEALFHSMGFRPANVYAELQV